MSTRFITLTVAALFRFMNDFADLTINWINEKFPFVKIDRTYHDNIIIVYHPPVEGRYGFGDWILSIKLKDNYVLLWGAMHRSDKPFGCKIPLSDPELYPLIEAYLKLSTKYRVEFH